MTPEQQIREALLDTSNALVPGTMTEKTHDALAALDRLVAERDEARQDAEDSATLAYEANEREKVLEGREAALREALERARAICSTSIAYSAASALAAVPAADPTPPEET